MRVSDFRRRNFTLSEEQRQLQEVFTALFQKESPTSRVRAAEPLGFDRELWRQLTEAGIVAMGLPEAAGGDGGGIVELAIVAQQFGRSLAPVPLVDALVATRLLASSGVRSDVVSDLSCGTSTACVGLRPVGRGEPQIVSGAAVADFILGLEEDVLVMFEAPPPPAIPNLANSPLARRALSGLDGTQTIIATGPAARTLFNRAILEWKILMASAQCGIAIGALQLVISYVNERKAFGVPIGTFQAVSHPLVDVATGIEGSKKLNLRAAWYMDHEPDNATSEVLMAFLYAVEVANRAASIGIHVQGGLGFTTESDMQLYFRRALGWALAAGDSRADLDRLGNCLYGLGTVKEGLV